MIIKGITGIFVGPKKRPKTYKARDAAYPTGGNAGFYIASRPRPYPLTPQQRKVRDTAESCGISKGISKADLQRKMVECMGPKMRH